MDINKPEQKEPAKTLSSFLSDTQTKKETDGSFKTVAVKMHVDTLSLVCDCLKLKFANRVSEKQIAVMAFRQILANHEAEVLKVIAGWTEEQQKQFAKDLSY